MTERGGSLVVFSMGYAANDPHKFGLSTKKNVWEHDWISPADTFLVKKQYVLFRSILAFGLYTQKS